MPSNDTSSPDATAAAITKNNWLVSAARNDAIPDTEQLVATFTPKHRFEVLHDIIRVTPL